MGIRELKDVKVSEEARGVKEVKELKEAREVEGAKGSEEEKEAKGAKESEEAREVKGVKEPEEVRAVKGVKEPEEAREVKRAKEPEEVREVKGAKEPEEAKEVKGAKESEEAREVKRAKEPKAVRVVKGAKEPEEVREVKRAKEPEEARVVKEVKLSGRLQAVADMVGKGNVVCDVGCDHGFVPIYLVERGISPKVIAMDINKGPLKAAREHIGEYFLADYIETRLSDGLAALGPGEADTVICAGMGGRLVVRILEDGREKLMGVEELVLQPQSEVRLVREYLRERGYSVVDENMVWEEGKFYPMMRVGIGSGVLGEALCGAVGSGDKVDGVVGGDVWQWNGLLRSEDGLRDRLRLEDKYGPVLLQRKHPVLQAYLHREIGICEQILGNLKKYGKGQEAKQEEIMGKLEDARMALSYF